MADPFSDTDVRGPLPGPLRAARVLLYVFAGVTVLTVAGGLMGDRVEGGSAGEVAGSATALALTGVLALVCALRMRKGRRPLMWGVVALTAYMVLGAVSAFGQGDPRGLVQLVLPVTVMVLVLLPGSRAYLR